MTLALRGSLRNRGWIVWSAGACLFAALGSHAVSGPPSAGNPDIIVIDPATSIAEHKQIPKEALAPGSPIPSAGGQVLYNTPGLRVGVWESEPGTLLLNMTFDEYVHILEGTSVLRRADGKTWTFKAGDSFLLPSGFKGQARQIGHFKKEYVDILQSGHPATAPR
jgi:hypothetical protein